jgi:acetyl esterase/lipase
MGTMRRIAVLLSTIVLGCGDVVEQHDISYDDRNPADVLDLYTPPPAGTRRPGVLVIHGGGWKEGIYRASMARYAERLAEAGYVAVNIDYRLTPDGGMFPHAVQDSLCALAFMRAHAAAWNVDPDRIAALGYSAGGHLVSMLGVAANAPVVQPDCAAGGAAAPAAVVAGAGPTDLTALLQVSAVVDFVGGTLAEAPDLYRAASPITYVAPGAPPWLFVHGDNDWFVDFDKQTRPMKAALDAAGGETRLFELPGGGHIWNRGVDDGEWEIPNTSLDSPEAEAGLFDFLDHTIGPVP